MSRRRYWITACLVAAAVLYGAMMVVSVMPHPAVQFQRTFNVLWQFDPRNGVIVAFSNQTNSVYVAGPPTKNVLKRLRKLFSENPGAEYLVLRSFGAMDDAVKEVSDLVRDHGVKTLVVDYCYNTCTAVFLSGKKQYVSRRGALLMPGIESQVGDFNEHEREMDRLADETGPSAEILEGIAAEFRNELTKKVDVQVVESLAEFAGPNWRRKMKDLGRYTMPFGYFYQDNDQYFATVVAGLAWSPADARVTLAHEIYGHAALAHWRSEGLDVHGWLIQFAERRPDLINERAEVYGFSDDQKAKSAEEALARIAGYQPRLNALEDLLASHRIWLRQNLFPNLYYSDKEIIKSYIVPMRRSMTEAKS